MRQNFYALRWHFSCVEPSGMVDSDSSDSEQPPKDSSKDLTEEIPQGLSQESSQESSQDNLSKLSSEATLTQINRPQAAPTETTNPIESLPPEDTAASPPPVTFEKEIVLSQDNPPEELPTNNPEDTLRFHQKFFNKIFCTFSKTRSWSQSQLQNRFGETQWYPRLKNKLENFDPSTLAEWTNQQLHRKDSGFYGKIITAILCSFFLADLTALLAGRLIPAPPVGRFVKSGSALKRVRTLDDYNVIFSRNIFNSKGLIPGDGGPLPTQDPNGPAVRTTLPFNLIGTIILRDELRSLATIEDKTASMVYPVRIQDEIPSKAKITRIEPRRVTFINTTSGRLEYVELPEDPSVLNTRITISSSLSKGSGGPGIEQVATNQFNVSRAEIDKAFRPENMASLMTQARAVPNVENGVTNGFKLFQIEPGSLYAQIGLLNEDVLLSANGDPINDPMKAMGMLNSLKELSHVELKIKRNGREMPLIFDIR